MGTSVIDAARAYIADAIGRGIGAVSAASVAKRLKITEDQAIAVLNCLVETEGSISIHGCIGCPECLEQIDLKATKLADLIREAESLAGRPCLFCGQPLPGGPETRVQLSFFCQGVVPTDSGTTAHSNNSGALKATAAPTTTVDLAHLKDIQKIRCDTLIIASSGSTVLVGETVSQAASGGVVAGLPLKKPWPLNGSGAKKPKPTDTPAELEFRPYKEKDWTPLGLV